MNILKIVAVFALAVSAAFGQVTPPQGRLSLSSTNAVMTSDVVNATTIYYLGYPNGNVPLREYYDGTTTTYSTYPFAPQTLTLNSSQQTSGNIYDIFAFWSSYDTTALGIGPAWASATSRGTGSTSTAIQQDSTLGVWMNVNAITLWNGTNSYSINAGCGTYLGSVYMTGNGETSMQFQPASASGGSGNILGLYNAYNHVTVSSRSIDSTSSWSYSTASWRAADNSTSNRITWLDGLQQSFVRAEYQVQTLASSGNIAYVGVGLDSTTSPTGVIGDAESILVSLRAAADIEPQLGLHDVQALEYSQAGSGTTYYGTNAMQLKAVLAM